MSIRIHFFVAAFLSVVALPALGAPTNAPVITTFGSDGTLRWQDSATNATYRVEWTPSLQEDWRMSWDALRNIPATSNGNHAVPVPMFYRVVRTEASGADDVQKHILTLDAHSATNTLSATQREATLWATLDGTVYRVTIESKGPVYMGVGQKRQLTAKVTPAIPGTFIWSITGDKATLENADHQTVTIVAGSEPSETVGDQTITVSFKPSTNTTSRDE
ncbi:MAG: hypothetical protein ISS35_02160 [Kiritimatiellae bacterium]|nr:hypothetical protein [Kiritimatiellia bacterium]